MKIKKNLSDEEMFKGYVEKESFENAFDADEKIVSSKMKNKAAAAKELLLPAEAQEKLNQYLLEISMDWFKNGNGDVVWKIYKEQGQIIIKPAPATFASGRAGNKNFQAGFFYSFIIGRR
mgnify:CR=1 FL=1